MRMNGDERYSGEYDPRTMVYKAIPNPPTGPGHIVVKSQPIILGGISSEMIDGMGEMIASELKRIDSWYKSKPKPGEVSHKSTMQRMPLLQGIGFEHVRLEFISDDAVNISVADQKARPFNYVEMGMKDGRKGDRKTKLWELLFKFAEGNGVWRWDLNGDGRYRAKDIQRLKKRLQEFFVTDQNPFHRYQKSKGYRCRFTIVDKSG